MVRVCQAEGCANQAGVVVHSDKYLKDGVYCYKCVHENELQKFDKGDDEGKL